MKVILQKDVKDLGKVGEVVSVKQGFARNFLFPRRLAEVATEDRMKEWQHLQRVAEVKQKKAEEERKSVADKVNGITITFKRQAGDNDKLFGSVTTHDISLALAEQGFEIDRKDVKMDDVIKQLGQHRAEIVWSENTKAEISISVEKE